MPFHETEDTVVQVQRPPRAVERWLRRIFLEDWGLKLLALAITLSLWFAVTAQNKPGKLRIPGVELNFLRPNNLEISNDPPASIEVILNGNKHKLDRISARDLVATLDVRDLRQGDRVVHLSGDRLELELPEGVRLEGCQPSTISLRLEPRIDREVDVEVKVEGKVADGYQLYGVSSTPKRVRLSGPASHVEAILKAPTESLTVSGRKETFTVSQLAIVIPDQKVDVIDTVVDVRVEIGQRAIERSFAGMPERYASANPVPPGGASVKLRGSPALLVLGSSDVKAFRDVSGGEHLRGGMNSSSQLLSPNRIVQSPPLLFRCSLDYRSASLIQVTHDETFRH